MTRCTARKDTDQTWLSLNWAERERRRVREADGRKVGVDGAVATQSIGIEEATKIAHRGRLSPCQCDLMFIVRIAHDPAISSFILVPPWYLEGGALWRIDL